MERRSFFGVVVSSVTGLICFWKKDLSSCTCSNWPYVTPGRCCPGHSIFQNCPVHSLSQISKTPKHRWIKITTGDNGRSLKWMESGEPNGT